MLFTRECDYAIRIMRALSANEIMSVPKICGKEQMPSPMTYKIARKLEKAGLLKSYRGNAGGYALNRNLDSITMYDVCAVIDPDILVAECMKDDHICPMNEEKSPCRVHCEFSRIQGMLVRELKKRSLEEVFRK